ncbi:hypothetical protein OG21DRAFT_1491826 [Imleria badia]|nr:hypothetical protein OG21DRAFT_1491826 [Imleria badia]
MSLPVVDEPNGSFDNTSHHLYVLPCPHTLKLATQSDGDEDDATIVPARSSQHRHDHLLPSPQHSTPHPYPQPQLPAHPQARNNVVVTTCRPALNPSPNNNATSTPSPTINDNDHLSVVMTAHPHWHWHSPPQPIKGCHDDPPPPHLHVLNNINTMTTMTTM